jgi:membrane protein implicated in regulation of membrane protease activity
MESFFILENAPYLWLVLGALMLAIEAFGATGIGFLFAGLGAIIAAIAAHLGWAETVWGQTSYFFGATVLWAALLWIPMQRLKAQKHAGAENFSNMQGDEVVVLSDVLEAGKTGEVRWSGTTMKAKLSEGSPSLKKDDVALIAEVKGTLLIVTPQSGE